MYFQVGDMIDVLGGNLNLNGSSLSDEERGFLYMRMQKQLALQTNLNRETVNNFCTFMLGRELCIYVRYVNFNKIFFLHLCLANV